MTDNPYIPMPATIDDVTVENEAKDIKSFQLVFERAEDASRFRYLPGQFAEVSIFGKGEAPIGIASSPTEGAHLLFTVKRTGVVTAELHNSEPGRGVGVRGPLGKPYPWERMEGRNLVIIGGGFAFTTLRSVVAYVLDAHNRSRFGKVTVIYGARTPGELIYKDKLKEWGASGSLDLVVTVDAAVDGWSGKVGFVPAVVREVAPSARNAIALVCGPPIMLKFTMPELLSLGFAKDDVYVSLEMRMKCGIGKCGRCNIGRKYVCIDGPVFSYAELVELPSEF